MSETHPAEIDAPCKEWTGDREYVIHPAHSWVGAASDPPWCNNCGEVWTPRVTPPEATPTTNAARPEGDDSSAREGITAR